MEWWSSGGWITRIWNSAVAVGADESTTVAEEIQRPFIIVSNCDSVG